MVLEYEVRERIAYITLNRPRAMNAMNQELKEKLADAIEQVDRDPDVWVAIVTGAGDKAFSSRGRPEGIRGPGSWKDQDSRTRCSSTTSNRCR